MTNSEPNPYESPKAPSTTEDSPVNYHPKWLAFVSFGVAFAGGFAVWAVSEEAVGEVEPWDAGYGYYFCGVFLAAALGSLVSWKSCWAAPVGVWLGQTAYCTLFYQPSGPAILTSLLVTLIFGLGPSVVGAVLGASANALAHLVVKSR